MTSLPPRFPLGPLPHRDFLRRYWQKRPLLIRNAWPRFHSPLGKKELFALACSATVESRLVRERGSVPWQVEHGPFTASRLRAMPTSHSTLLVQDVDKHLPEVESIIERFAFIPTWRIDDVMISYATPQGSVGPHYDNYDVFLLQGAGERTWQLTRDFDATALLPDIDLRILRKFSAQNTVTVRPGDVLYLPPGVAHYGTNAKESITWSIGFRAPSQRELMFRFGDELLARSSDAKRYADPALELASNPGLLDDQARSQIRELIGSALRLAPLELDRWFGRYITEPKPGLGCEREPVANPEATLKRLSRSSQAKLRRALGSRWTYFVVGNNAHLFVDGEELIVGSEHAALIAALCNGMHPNMTAMRHLLNVRSRRLLLELIARGLLIYQG